jgi:hypothetical protein
VQAETVCDTANMLMLSDNDLCKRGHADLYLYILMIQQQVLLKTSHTTTRLNDVTS